MRGHNNRRLRIWRLDGRAISLIFSPDYQITRGLPDVTVVDARFDGVRGAVLVLESPFFSEVAEGEFIPEIDVILTTRGLNVAS